uniref:Ig-like domain-containing protein n=1 Tax=Bos indicus x Bos taurus TaxID=30522 RepID=A0A4W2GLZ8_BOBOX
MRLVIGVTVFLTLGTVINAKTTQPSSMDCAEGENVNLPCNHSTIGGDDYIYWYQKNPNQSPQYVIHGLRGTVNSSTGSLHIASDRKSSTLVLPQVTLRDTAVYYCVLREAHWDRRGCTCAVSLWWEEGGVQSWGSCHESKSRIIWKENQKSSKR